MSEQISHYPEAEHHESDKAERIIQDNLDLPGILARKYQNPDIGLDIEELTSEGLVKLVLVARKIATNRDIEFPRRFLSQAIINCYLNLIRSRLIEKGRLDINTTDIDPEETSNNAALQVDLEGTIVSQVWLDRVLDKVEAMLHVLTPEHKQAIFDLLEELKVEEIAIRDGVAPGTVKSRRFRAIIRLRRALGVIDSSD